VRNNRAFTLIEIVISVFILMLLLAMAVPSLTGVLADKRLRRSLDSFNNLVHQAQEHSLAEHRSYLVVWTEKGIEVRPEILVKGDARDPIALLPLGKSESISLNLTAALTKEPPAEWIFWPTGTCEPATIKYVSRDGTWSAKYSPLTARADLTNYAAR
jgi:type II secretory pathway pseudopilin PulG